MLFLSLVMQSWLMYLTSSDLIHLVSLSRHGNRAPNPIVQHLCPNNMQNYQAYHTPPEQLTERGMKQLQQAGEHIREVYVNQKRFLNVSFNGPHHQHFETYFRADAATRCGQSAAALGYGLYPDGSGPGEFKKQPLPIFMQLPENEHDFGAGGPCWQVSNQHLAKYARTRGHDLILKHQMMLQQVASICGADFYISKDPILAIKDVADMFLFDLNQGLPLLPGMNEDLLVELNSLSFQHMIERLYTTPREITYACGGFPLVMLRDLQRAAKLSSENRNTAMSFKYHSYHGHRELLHGLGFMMGLKFNFDGLLSYNGSTPLIPGTTLFIELHTKQEHKPDPYFVKLYVWTPETKRTLLKLHQCPHECSLSNFTNLITSFIVSTGTWEDICHYHPQVLDVAIMLSEVRRYLPTFTGMSNTQRNRESESLENGNIAGWIGFSCIVIFFVYFGLKIYRLHSRRLYSSIG